MTYVIHMSVVWCICDRELWCGWPVRQENMTVTTVTTGHQEVAFQSYCRQIVSMTSDQGMSRRGGGLKLEIEIMSHSSECHLNIVVCHVMSIMDPLRQEQSLNWAKRHCWAWSKSNKIGRPFWMRKPWLIVMKAMVIWRWKMNVPLWIWLCDLPDISWFTCDCDLCFACHCFDCQQWRKRSLLDTPSCQKVFSWVSQSQSHFQSFSTGSNSVPSFQFPLHYSCFELLQFAWWVWIKAATRKTGNNCNLCAWWRWRRSNFSRCFSRRLPAIPKRTSNCRNTTCQRQLLEKHFAGLDWMGWFTERPQIARVPFGTSHVSRKVCAYLHPRQEGQGQP